MVKGSPKGRPGLLDEQFRRSSGGVAALLAAFARPTYSAAQPERRPMSLLVPTAPGEFLDKLTILEIKADRIRDAAKLANVGRELAALRATWAASPLAARDVTVLVAQLRAVNEKLWEIEDAIREKEAARAFDAEFIELARSVYRTNDRRAALKRELNVLLGSELIEEKSYAKYEP